MIVTIVGARPQFVKAAVVSKALKDIGITESIIHTGQHYDKNMSDIFWKELSIPQPAFNLGIGSGPHGAQTGKMIQGIEQILLGSKKPVSGILLYGDTNSTLAGAIVGSKMIGVPIFHVEAGLRSYNRSMPEEINRVVTDSVSDFCFCSSETGVENLRKEGNTDGVHNVGDVMLDALTLFRPLSYFGEKGLKNGEYALLTVHRPSNTSKSSDLQEIIEAVSNSVQQVLWPVHPRCRSIVADLSIPNNVIMVPPLSYLEMLHVLKECKMVFTDSGGLQKEAYWMKKRCFTLREDTEWVETLKGNWNILVGKNRLRISEAVGMGIETDWEPLYGDGSASKRIAKLIEQYS